MTDIDKFLYQRRSIKGRVTKLENHLKTVTSLDPADITRKVCIDLESRLSQLKNLQALFDDVQTNIEVLSNQTDFAAQELERHNFDETCYTLIADYSYVLEINGERERTTESRRSPTPISTVASHSVSDVKLPPIPVPHFDGSLERWVEFKDMFGALIHNDNNLSNVKKFHYLKSALSGDAVNIIQSITISDANYSIAWDMLCNRFKNTELLVNTYVKALHELPTQSRESVTGLRNIVDSSSKNIQCLKALDQPVDKWDVLLIYLITSKLDNVTKREWQCERSKANSVPTYAELEEFLQRKCSMLETLHTNKQKEVYRDSRFLSQSNTNFNTKTRVMTSHVSAERLCTLCKQRLHPLYYCAIFRRMPVYKRISEVKKLRLCSNCLGDNHSFQSCPSTHSCHKCNSNHHTLLHPEDNSRPVNVANDSPQGDTNSNATTKSNVPGNSNFYDNTSAATTANHCALKTICHSFTTPHHSEVLLSTAVVNVMGTSGNYLPCRVLLDPGSQSNFITFNKSKELNLKSQRDFTTLSGVNGSSTDASFKTTIRLKSRTSNYETNVPCLIVPKITQHLPLMTFDKHSLNIPKNIVLADPNFNISGEIDILLGAEFGLCLLSIGQICLGEGCPTLQKSKLGWIVGGKLVQDNSPTTSIVCTNTLDQAVQRFWEVETLPAKAIRSSEDQLCEEHFMENTVRNEQGQYVVKIPLKAAPSSLGDSRLAAEQRFFRLESRFQKNSSLKQAYSSFINEYMFKGHMSKVDEEVCKPLYFLPHHPVIKGDSLTTKLRVVFDGSCLTTNNNSLNSIQMKGPIVQDDLYSILLRFRKYKFVITADIEKMYRQILVAPEDRSFQCILWRDNANSELDCYQLNTVTYGTTSAPFLATRCLLALADSIHVQFPTESEIIKNDFYVDDLLSGSNNLEELQQIKTNITSILASAKFPLRKWLSNNQSINSVSSGNHTVEFFNLNDDTESKILGLVWDAKEDTLQCAFDGRSADIQKRPTKRSILSTTARIFDPLGLFSPVVVVAKLILQQLWKLDTSWDESVPQTIHTQWSSFCCQLHILSDVRVPRWVFGDSPDKIELHGFSDASTLAYGACVYARCVNALGEGHTCLLSSKSRVAPVKQVTLPRLELCASVVLAQLMNKIIDSMKLHSVNTFYWTDSTITLAWIKSCPTRWKTFVANRTSEIQNLSKSENWHHVSSKDNPADLVSRGMSPSQLLTSTLWWNGPPWLTQSTEHWPTHSGTYICEDQSEMKSVTLHSTQLSTSLFAKFSSFNRLTRVIAYCLRFLSNCKIKGTFNNVLSKIELTNATTKIVKLIQEEAFDTEIGLLLAGKSIKGKSLLGSLSIFLDEFGILRVGGRLRQTTFTFNKRFPMLLPGKHKITKLIAQQEHLRLLHCGPQELLYSLRENYWPTSGRSLARHTVRSCVKCFRVKPTTTTYKMGDLPKSRITAALPFSVCGVDYAGPIGIRDRRGRGFKVDKHYICVFICFITKAIHLELVQTLTTEAFIAAFRRFVSRRGKPSEIFSDNATNFVGANAELVQLAKFFNTNGKEIQERMNNLGVTWSFIPPRAPHFGGLWESAVRLVKYHLKRVLGEALLTYEEMLTVLLQIEAVLNSRPLTPLNSDPNDLNPLTPAHFLIGRAFTSLADPDLSHLHENQLGRFQHLQRIMHNFWKRWNKEYISELQTRTKWKENAINLRIDDLVVIKEDNLPPFKWRLGRICDLHIGKDDVARVASVRLGDSTIMKRSTNRLCALPNQEILLR